MSSLLNSPALKLFSLLLFAAGLSASLYTNEVLYCVGALIVSSLHLFTLRPNLLKLTLKRVSVIIPMLLIIVLSSFFIMHAVPGGPFSSEKTLSPAVELNIKEKYGLDKPIYEQAALYVGNLLSGDFGYSMRKDLSINAILADNFHYTIKIGIGGLFFAILIGLLSGFIAASKPNSLRDYSSMTFAILGVCLPSFVIGPLLVMAFAFDALGIYEAMDMAPFFAVGGIEELKDYFLPCLTLGILYSATIARLTRAGLLNILKQDFIRTAKAKGLKGYVILWKHALKGGISPVVSYLGPAVVGMLSGSIVVEKVFNVPGIGSMIIDGSINRDYTLVMAIVIIVAIMIQLSNLIVDIFLATLDPRVAS